VGEANAVQEFYTPKRLHKLVKTWRKTKQGKSLCEGFCQYFGTGECPNSNIKPKEGHCDRFVVRAKDVIEAQELIDADMMKAGICLQRGHSGQSTD
jgi:hypothetical protein